MVAGTTARGGPAADETHRLAEWRRRVDDALAGFCDRYLGDVEHTTAEAIRYSLLGEGKRLRPVLVLAAYDATGGGGDASALAAAVEVVHAYSLVHDDLPCMDDDDVRRGRPTVHRVFGVRAATAAGLAMVPLAALAARDAAASLGLDAGAVATVVRELMRASGAGGMIGGQLLDLEAEGRALTLAELERVHAAKTGALITAAVVVGGVAGGASAPVLRALEVYGVRAATAAGLTMVPLAALATRDAAVALGLAPAAVTAIVRELMRASGAGGMIGGQLLDLEAEGRALTLEELQRVHAAKTGALITAAVVVGGIAGGAPEPVRRALETYGRRVGLAFQIVDDVLDVTATTDELGKTAGRDVALGKSTYPALLGVEGARSRAAALVDEACAALAEVGLLTVTLEHLARFSISRRS